MRQGTHKESTMSTTSINPNIPVTPQAIQQAQRLIPSVTGTVLVTLFFGIFGLIPAVLNSNRARAMGAPTSKYWAAFGWIFGAYFVLLFIIMAASGASA